MKGGADHIEDVIRAVHPDTCTLDTHKSEIRVKSTVSDGIKSKNTFGIKCFWKLLILHFPLHKTMTINTITSRNTKIIPKPINRVNIAILLSPRNIL